MGYETILAERHGPVLLVTLNRPGALNALNARLIGELDACLDAADGDDAVAAVVITGSAKAFAAGADVKEMMGYDYAEAARTDFIAPWAKIARHRKPLIAAVAGFALGGGCELAMMCDIILAADNARFGQPEVGLGIIPGAGGTQRLTRAIGKSKAMEMVLTGRMLDAAEAERAGLVSRVVPADRLLAEALALGEAIAARPRPAVRLARQAVDAAFETSLQQGILLERQAFYSSFGTHDGREGMAAFVAKRTPEFRDG